MFTVQDKSLYLRGLLVVARQDNKLHIKEKEFIRRIAQDFGFSKDFYEEILRDLLSNKYLSLEPIIFSSTSVAEKFLHDGMKLANSDRDLHENEIKWLSQVAEANGLADAFISIKKDVVEKSV